MNDTIPGRSTPAHEYVLVLSSPDRPGIVASVARLLYESGGNIEESQQFDDRRTGMVFMRIAFTVEQGGLDLEGLRAAFRPLAQRLGMTWQLWNMRTPYRTLIMVSRFGHCLNDMLFRWSNGELNIEIPAIVSNHRDFERLADAYGIPFHHIPVTAGTKAQAEERLVSLVRDLDIHLVVLARYMQVLSDDLAREMSGRIINIHHSFLPSFKGAKPYHQAFDRGVKLIGATAHYVTSDLDEGQIIEQDVARVDHRMEPAALASAGKACETRVLTRAVRWHAERRVLLVGDRTVVFS